MNKLLTTSSNTTESMYGFGTQAQRNLEMTTNKT